ncbi:MAG TPA: ABC transporter ATP-binding protein [Rhodospirillales bacterium]|jgi:branched-chain amino acid transport system ATP-binding protein|nr:ABC transporter ATP-binding protein [Rhodospirillales bacterium]HJO69804.1 ABC transporter ATP-binding protein [Rhodospirillales bacterium]
MSVLAVRGLSKSFGGVQAVRELDFDVAEGEVVAMIGPNGAGKTTCFNMIGGQLRPDAGSIVFRERQLAGLGAPAIWRLGVGRTFQLTQTFASMTVRENVQAALISHRGRTRSVFARAKTLFAAQADALLARVGLVDHAELACASLAYGDLKRLELAVALANAPRLLLLDEPTAGISANERQGLMVLIAEVVSERRISVLFTEHDMDVVFGHAARVLVLHRGRLVAEGDPDTVRADARVREIYLGSGVVGGRAED